MINTNQKNQRLLYKRLNTSIKHWPSPKARRWVENFVQKVPELKDIEVVLAIGSSVRAVKPRQSDVDFIVLHHGEKPEIITPPIDVDIRFFNVHRVEKLISEGNDLLGWALRFGKPVYDPNGFWSVIIAKWRAKAPFPSFDIAYSRADKALKLGQDLLAMGDEDAAREQYLTMLTHLARARLLQAGVYPISRPELPGQLRSIGEHFLADRLNDALKQIGPFDFKTPLTFDSVTR